MQNTNENKIYSDDLLVLCWKYLQVSGNRTLCKRFIDLVQRSIRESLESSNITKSRDHLWFKQLSLQTN